MKIGYVIAIDGPSGAGKSSAAKLLARKLGYRYIDTGAMYRAAALAAHRMGVDINDPAQLEPFLDELVIMQEMSPDGVLTRLGSDDVSDEIRKEEMGMKASAISALGPVRDKITELARRMGEEGGVVMEGRDIGTVVFPGADFKFFLGASAEQRAKRRYEELLAKGEKAEYEEVLAEIRKRDHNDSTRVVAPLKKAGDSREIDSTSMTLDEVVDTMAGIVKSFGDGDK